MWNHFKVRVILFQPSGLGFSLMTTLGEEDKRLPCVKATWRHILPAVGWPGDKSQGSVRHDFLYPSRALHLSQGCKGLILWFTAFRVLSRMQNQCLTRCIRIFEYWFGRMYICVCVCVCVCVCRVCVVCVYVCAPVKLYLYNVLFSTSVYGYIVMGVTLCMLLFPFWVFDEFL